MSTKKNPDKIVEKLSAEYEKNKSHKNITKLLKEAIKTITWCSGELKKKTETIRKLNLELVQSKRTQKKYEEEFMRLIKDQVLDDCLYCEYVPFKSRRCPQTDEFAKECEFFKFRLPKKKKE